MQQLVTAGLYLIMFLIFFLIAGAILLKDRSALSYLFAGSMLSFGLFAGGFGFFYLDVVEDPLLFFIRYGSGEFLIIGSVLFALTGVVTRHGEYYLKNPLLWATCFCFVLLLDLFRLAYYFAPNPDDYTPILGLMNWLLIIPILIAAYYYFVVARMTPDLTIKRRVYLLVVGSVLACVGLFIYGGALVFLEVLIPIGLVIIIVGLVFSAVVFLARPNVDQNSSA